VKQAPKKVCGGRDGGMPNDWSFHWESLLAVNVYVCVCVCVCVLSLKMLKDRFSSAHKGLITKSPHHIVL
jgi:hypothetical protein